MKKLTLLSVITLSIVLSSCAGYNQEACYEAVKKEFPSAIAIKKPSNKKYTYIVKDIDKSIYFVEAISPHRIEVTFKEVLFDHKTEVMHIYTPDNIYHVFGLSLVNDNTSEYKMFDTQKELNDYIQEVTSRDAYKVNN